MDNKETQFQKDARRVHLLALEKEAIKRRIIGVPVPQEYRTPAFSFTSINFTFAGRMAMAVLLASILSTAPLAYAAQESAPGDALYHLELYVIEPIEAAFRFTPETQIAYATDRLEERLEELQTIPTEDIAPEEIAIVVENIEEHAEEVLTVIEENASEEAVDDIVRASALLHVHEDLIAEVSQEQTRIKNFNDVVAAELQEQLTEYADEATPLEIVEEIQETVAETVEILEDNLDSNSGLAAQLSNVEIEVNEGNFTEALQEATAAKVQAFVQEYSEQSGHTRE